MFKTKDFGRLTVGIDTRQWPGKPTAAARWRWWPPLWAGRYAIWFVPVPWVFACWQRDR